MPNATTRFTDRVEDYVKFRPHYPQQIIQFLEQQIGLTREAVIADVGSGTGISSELFLKNGNRVIGVEPNANMRRAAEHALRHFNRFTSVEGTAESTTLSANSVDVIIAGQAFHWFDRTKTRAEFERTGRHDVSIILMWNDRRNVAPFMLAYEAFVQQFSADYETVNHKNIDDETIREFLAPAAVHRKEFYHSKMLSREALVGLICSSSYMPNREDVRFPAMLEAIDALFSQCEKHHTVQMDYECKLYYGRLNCL